MRWLVALLFIPLAAGQLLEDPSGDVEMSAWENSAGAVGNWDPVDLRFLTMEELPDELLFTVGIEGFPTCEGGACQNAGDLRTYFQYGELAYYVQQGIDPQGNAYARLNSVEPGGVDGPAIAVGLGATKDFDAKSVTAQVPRELILDESGTPPIKNATLTGLLTRAYSQFSIGGPDPTGSGSTDMFVTRDQMGFQAPASFTFAFGGSETTGPIDISSPAPFRASNGGSASYTFEVNVTNRGEDASFTLGAERVPSDWTFYAPDVVDIPGGSSMTIPVAVDTLSAHRHGGSETVTVVVEGPESKGKLELGIHYVTVPQPAGHHPTLFLHTLTDGTLATAATAFGNDDGRIWMNALEDDPGDEKVPVVAQGGVQGMAGQSAQWSICLIPNLRLGLDMDLTRQGELEIVLGSTNPYLGVTVSGRIIHIAGPEPLDFCDPRLWADRETTTIATVGPSGSQDIQGGTQTFTSVIQPEPAGDFIPYEPGAQMVLELTATYQGGAFGPTGLAMHPGGELTLPLLEYRDERPPGALGDSVIEETNTTVEDEPMPVKESPLPPVLTLLAILAARRRYST